MATPKHLQYKTITPVGRAIFMTPVGSGSQFDPDKVEAGIIISAEEMEAMKAKMCELIDNNKKELGYDSKKAKFPFIENKDSDGNPTGEYRLKAKTKVIYSPQYVDANGVTFEPEQGFKVPNGAEIRLAITVVAVDTAMHKGITCRLNGIQVKSITSYDLGFDAVAGGDFTYDESAGDDSDNDSGADWA